VVGGVPENELFLAAMGAPPLVGPGRLGGGVAEVPPSEGERKIGFVFSRGFIWGGGRKKEKKR